MVGARYPTQSNPVIPIRPFPSVLRVCDARLLTFNASHVPRVAAVRERSWCIPFVNRQRARVDRRLPDQSLNLAKTVGKPSYLDSETIFVVVFGITSNIAVKKYMHSDLQHNTTYKRLLLAAH